MRPLTPEQDDLSALTHRTMAQITQAADAIWQSNRAAAVFTCARHDAHPRRRKTLVPVEPSAEPNLHSLPKARLAFIEPMLAEPVKTLPEGPEWSYELKLDG